MTHGCLDVLMDVQADGARRGLAEVFPQDLYPFPVGAVRARWEQELTDPTIDCFVIVEAARLVEGFVALQGDQLLHFGTAVHTWGTGLADRAHDDVVALWRAAGLSSGWLRVFEGNARARSFYQRHGWRPTGERSASTFAPFPTLLRYELDLSRGA
ncbi:MAG: GNAT family N-acetyltransferase [Frankiales bacterium]|nr:GNAT family N-acetyltransferase [Frankiales bacterium]